MNHPRLRFGRSTRVALVGILVVAAGAATWSFSRPRAIKARPTRTLDHWAAVTRGQDWLQRKRPDLAL